MGSINKYICPYIQTCILIRDYLFVFQNNFLSLLWWMSPDHQIGDFVSWKLHFKNSALKELSLTKSIVAKNNSFLNNFDFQAYIISTVTEM